MSDVETRFHAEWLGMVQPIEGLVVSVPVLIEAQSMARQPPEVQQTLLDLCPPIPETSTRAIADITRFFEELLGHPPSHFDATDAIPEDISLYVPEGGQTLRPTLALKSGAEDPRYIALVWDLAADNTQGIHTDLDKPETVTGPWAYPASAKLDRLLRHARIPIGILTNRRVVRLVYAPHGESTGAITFRIDDMASVGGRPILDAFVMLLSATRFFGVAEERSLPAILRESRKRQANVTSELAAQVFEALEILLAGFESAAERDGDTFLREALERDDDHLYAGLMTVLLRLVFVLYAEDRGLLPVEHELYASHLSALGLFARLQEDAGAHPDSMPRRFGAYAQLVTLFRAIYLGVEHNDFRMPPRRGELFDPHRYPFLEGWGPAGSAPLNDPDARAAVRVPSVDDGTIHRVLEKLLLLEGQRLSYRALDVEQIGSVYEGLMGHHVVRLTEPAVCLRPNRVWITAEETRSVAPAQRAKWIQETAGLSKAQATKLAEATKAAKDNESILEALEPHRVRATTRAPAGRLVIQPGAERRRTSSHYTPRSLSAPIVRRTLEPLLAVMGDAPASERILNLKVCDPAMGSGAFLVEACRFLGDALLAAWTREGKLHDIATAGEDPLEHARRLIAQRCLYGVDKNPFAVTLAKLSLWLITLAKDLPFTFLDHALRHGDSLVGLSFDQIRAFHWKPKQQLELTTQELDNALTEAITLRQHIADLANDTTPSAQREKERLLWDAEDALDRARLIADICIGAFFAHAKDKDREKERTRRLDRIAAWLNEGGAAPEDLREMQQELRAQVPAFHWMIEYPEVFYAERPDPLDENQVNRAAYMDAFIGNPPFMGGGSISGAHGDAYLAWILASHERAHGNADYCAHFFRRADCLLGAHGTIAFIATNTIAQGDTRTSGLKPLLDSGLVIYDAIRSMIWPGSSNVAVALVHLAKGGVARVVANVRLDERPTKVIDSRLRAAPEHPDPMSLCANDGLSTKGVVVAGMGFKLTPSERESLVNRDSRNAQCIFEFVGGDEINSDPIQSFNRYIINFGLMKLEQAEQWPDLLGIVRERVKPHRDRSPRLAASWWHFERPRPGLSEAALLLERCLVTSITSKYRCFASQPAHRVFDQTLAVFPVPHRTFFAIMQSRVHVCWAHLLSSSMRNDVRYIASDCFETFPFPATDPRTIHPALEDIGERLYTARAQYMIDTNQGLTQTYNQLKDPNSRDPRILDLRTLHEEMDRAVLTTYAWPDIPVPPYCPTTETEKKALTQFEDEIIDRLFLLNAQRAEEQYEVANATQKSKRTSRNRR